MREGERGREREGEGKREDKGRKEIKKGETERDRRQIAVRLPIVPVVTPACFTGNW